MDHSPNGKSDLLRGSNMKVTGYELFFVAPRWLFLKIETDEGITGWGEPVLEAKALTVAACVDEMLYHIMGRDPMQI